MVTKMYGGKYLKHTIQGMRPTFLLIYPSACCPLVVSTVASPHPGNAFPPFFCALLWRQVFGSRCNTSCLLLAYWHFVVDKISRWKNEKSRISWFTSSFQF